ncbi:hypothetical protein E2C01_012737 [Portunus trituberculatus]|uniref:Uncharacterized protein n=1 Tax=Portunus trituberculatus TaxID=210409 RepID=A0A5B7DF83_PORTR|nr:hypothetical protein [Portunus trituberculatus]
MKVILITSAGEGMKRRLTSRGSGWPGGTSSMSHGSNGDEHTRLIDPHSHSGRHYHHRHHHHDAGHGHRYMSTSDSEHDIIIQQFPLWFVLERSQTKMTSRLSDTQVPLGPALWCEGEGPPRDTVVWGEGRSAVWDVI